MNDQKATAIKEFTPTAPMTPPTARTAADSRTPKPIAAAEVPSPESVAAELVPDSARLSAMIDAIAEVSDPSPGVTRLAWTRTERRAHDLVAGWYRALGLKVWIDAVGNTIAELPGNRPAALGTGSHLDSVPAGGRFDGIAGVIAGVEVARLLVENGVRLEHSVRFVAFTAEEGARFGQACLGSKAVAGMLEESKLWSLRDADGISVAEAMQRVGLDPGRLAEARWAPRDWVAFLELHVEQGGVLEAAGLPIGIVDLVSGSTRVAVEVRGRATHTGSTPMALRADALTAAAEIVLMAEAIANDPRHRGTRASIGVLQVEPGSITTIPGRTTFTLDVRDVDSDRQRGTVTEIVRRAKEICDRRRVAMTVRPIGDSSPVVLPIWLRQTIADVCAEADLPYRVLTSGASHDCQMVNRVVPAALIFVPSQGGLSHVPEEWTSAADLAVGTRVLLHGLLRIDRRLMELERAAARTGEESDEQH
ncbi:Zn-dependent hydrolase [Nocardia sp. NPDC088792]|uniref:Zn-dependent hydrolase n=1 Tax=Nocardia sp. NPDC088792 TaxID=3364332 RepID=UPI00380D2B85